MRGRTRRASMPQVGDRVLLLDCKEVRMQGKAFVGQTATVKVVADDLQFQIKIDGSSSVLSVSAAAFLSSTSSLYGDLDIGAPAEDDDSMAVDQDSEEDTREEEGTEKIPANHVRQDDLSTPSAERSSKPNSSSLKKRKSNRTMHTSTAEPSVIRPRKTNRRSKLGSEELKKQNRTASFIAKRKAELVSQMHEPGYKNSKRLLGLEDALELPEELTNMLTKQNAIDTSEHSCKSDLKEPFDQADLGAREPRCRIGNSLKIMRGKIWRRGYIADYRESDSKYLVVSYQEDDISDSELDEEDDAARDRSWIDLRSHRFVEYTQVVWAKMNGWPHWPAQIYLEGKEEEDESKNESDTLSVVFFGTHDRANISQTKLLEYNTHKEECSKARRLRKKLIEAMEEADAVVERRRLRRNISLDVGDALKTLQRGLSARQWLGKRAWFWWPLDEMWYEGAVRRYDPHLNLHFIVYEDTVEWLNITSERISLMCPPGESSHGIDLLQLCSSSADAGLCFVCLRESVDSEASLLNCCACARRCHRHCVDASGRSDVELRAIRCPNCLRCQLCDDVRDFGDKLICTVCDMRVHASCLREDLVSSSSSGDNLFVCEECRICMSCNSRENVLKNSYTLCRACDEQISAGDCCQECFCVFQRKEKRATCIQCLRSLHQRCMACDTCRDCISLDLSKRLRPLVEHLVNEDKSMYFLNPVSDLEAPHYSEIVRVPMSFSNIISKLDQQQYSRIDEFRDDINLLWKNAFAYNKPSSAVFKDAVRLQKIAAASLEELEGVYAPSAPKKSSGSKSQTKHTSQQQLEVSPLVSSWLDYTAGLVGGEHLRQVDFCTLCLSSGLESDMFCCADCGECYHCFCLSSAPSVQRRDMERWRCPDCMVCEVCGEADQVDELLQCDVCDGGTHLRCHVPRLSRIPENGFRCQRCVECRCCGVTTPGKGPNARWMHDFTMCMACAQLYKQKKFCPVCDRVWRSTDSVPMVCCDACDMWVHNSCDAIDDHRYQDLTDNPTSKYYCPNCRSSSGVMPEEEPEPESETVIDKTSLRARDVAARSGDMTLPEVYSSMNSMLLAVQQKRRRSRRRLLLDTARHLAQGNSHVKVLPRKRAFNLTPVAPAAQRKLVPAPTVTGSSPVLLEAGASTPHRRCRLCHIGGVPAHCRLLRVGAFSWVHALCAIWSSEVLEIELGVLANLPRALVRGRETHCSSCGEFGATVNCCERSCAAAFHYRCAQQTACVFLADCRTFCAAHRTHVQAQVPEDTLGGQRIRRRLLTKAVPEPDSLWPCDDGAVVLRIGALSVEALGSIELAERFHTRAHIFPVGFRSHRIYWSYMLPGRRTLYTCTISRQTQPLRPLFSIVAADDPDSERHISADSASEAWSSMVARLPSFMQRNSKRRRASSGDTYAFGLSGPVFFGFGHPQVLPYISNLPGALECEHYTSVASACSSSGGGGAAANVSGSARTEIYHERSRNETSGNTRSGSRRSASSAEERGAGTGAGTGAGMGAGVGALYRRMKLESRPVARRSKVHGIGLFATQKYAASDMIIEFVGELIRSQIADQREKLYARRGIDSCFMFRIDEELVIDATTKGSVARFINHSCAANCTAKVLSFDGRNKKIIIVALRDIDVGEEICYDYKFTQEEQKLACHCKADACTGRLN